jgi:RNA polymerase sigma-70 factor (ECF subfamily)
MEWPGQWRRVKELADTHYDALFRYAYRLSGSAADAEDLTQETFCKAQMQLHQLRNPDRAKPWLFTILRNAYLHRVRTDRKHRAVPLDALDELPESQPQADQEIEPEQLQHALDALPEAFRTTVILFYFEEFSYRDIAEQMDVPMGTVMSRLARAKAHLKAALAQPTEARRPVHGL